MVNYIATEGVYKKLDSNLSTKCNGKYIPEDPEVIVGRKALAEFHISQGKSFKYAWWLAFQQYPRNYLPSEAPSSPEASTCDSKTCNDVYP